MFRSLIVLNFFMILAWASALGNIAGKVIDRTTKLPLANASVVVVGTGRGSMVDENGRYRIDSISVGQYSIQASLIGYRAVTKTKVLVPSMRTVDLDFELEEVAIMLPVTTVQPDFFPKEKDQATSKTELDHHEVRTDPEGYNLPRMLSSLPGVATSADYSSAIIVRGGSPDENLTILDNIEMANPSHFPEMDGGGGAFTIVNTDLVKNVTFSSGGFPARYGNKLSSFLNIESRDGNRENFEGMLDLSMVGIALTIEGPVSRRATYNLCYRRSFLEVLDKMSDIGDVIPRYDDVYARFTYEPSTYDKFSLLNVWTWDRMVVPKWSPNLKRDLQWDGGMLVNGLNWRHILSGAGFLQTNLTRSASWITLDAQDELFDRPRDVNYLFSTDLNYRLAKQVFLETGGQIGYWDVSESLYVAPYRWFTGDSIKEINRLLDTTTLRTSFFVQSRVEPVEFLKIIPGLRYDYLTLNSQAVVSPRISFSIVVLPVTTLNLAYGHYYQPLSFYYLLSEPELKFKKAIHYIAGIEQLITPSLQLSVEGYYKRLSRLPIPASRDPNADLDSVGAGVAKGIEFFLHQKLSNKIYGRIAYSYGLSERTDWRGTYDADWDQRHILTLIGGYAFTKDMEISMKFRYASGRPYTPYETTLKFQDPSTGKWYCPLSDAINSDNYPAYSRLDLQWAKTSHIGPVTITGYINVQNVLDRRNVFNYYWDVDKGEREANYQFYRMIVGGFQLAF